MRSLLSLLLVACLSVDCATVHGPRDIHQIGPGGPRLDDWTRVGELVPPEDVIVSTRQLQAATRVFVAADDDRLVVLNLTSSALTPASRRTLRAMAGQHPEAFSTSGAGSVVQDGVRVGRDGVFVADRRIGAFEETVETIARGDVIEAGRVAELLTEPVTEPGDGLTVDVLLAD